MDVSLGLDGTATVTEDAGNGTITHFGHWVETANQVKVSFDPIDGKPVEPPMTLQPEHDGLRAITWNHTTWARRPAFGEKPLPGETTLVRQKVRGIVAHVFFATVPSAIYAIN